MTREEIVSQIEQLIRGLVPEYDGEIAEDAAFAEIGVDSLSLVDLLVGAEQTFGIEIPDSQLAKLGTVRDVADFVLAARDQQPATA